MEKAPAFTAETILKIRTSLAWFYCFLGVAVLAGGITWAHHINLDAFILYSGRAVGEVIENREEHTYIAGKNGGSGRSFKAYRAAVQFTDANGKKTIFADQIAFNSPSFQKGEKLSVFFDPENPQDAQIDRGLKNLIIPGIILFFGILVLRGGILQVKALPKQQ